MATKFVECLRDTCLTQHITEQNHYRGAQKPNTLDLFITDEEGMVNNLEVSAPMGKSHHFCVRFTFCCCIDPEHPFDVHVSQEGL